MRVSIWSLLALLASSTAAPDNANIESEDSAAPVNLSADQVNAAKNQRSSTSPCCSLIKLVLGDKVSLPSSSDYTDSTKSYWSVQNNDIKPACIVSPTEVRDVSLTVGAITLINDYGLSCPFAVRGGGHAPSALATGDGQIVIDLSALKQVTLSSNSQTASIGAGARWSDVYSNLEKVGLGVTGGRVASVGVAGLTTGGGISFFSPKNGWACDTVTNFQEFVSNGMVYATPQVNPPAFQPFTNIQPQLLSTMRITTLSDLASELNDSTPYGFRELFFTITLSNDLATLTKLYETARDAMQPVRSVASLSNYAWSLEPLPTSFSKVGAQKGGNSLGVDPSDGDLVVVLMGVAWGSASDDQVIIDSVNKAYNSISEFAAGKGTLNQFQYINYADSSQKPITGYGTNNVNQLKAASKKYDPKQIFQKLVPSGFKLTA